MKVLADPVHGIIDLTELQTELINQPEFQRLAWLSQLSFTKLVFPGANHTRLEHSIGTSFIAGKMAKQLELTKDESKILISAGLLHDLGHSPLSHVLEKFLPKNHAETTADIVSGKEKLFLPRAGAIPDILESHGVDPNRVAKIIIGKEKSYLGKLISGDIDADRLDYLVRDAYYTGASHGSIGIHRLIKMLKIKDGQVCIMEKGIRSVEEMLVARMQMYSAVYWHHVSRIAGLMISQAVAPVIDQIPYFNSLNDFELIERLRKLGGFQKEIIERLLFRRLYKRAFVISRLEYPEFRSAIKNLKSPEQTIAETCGINKNHIIVDKREQKESLEPLNIPVLRKNGELVDMKELSVLAQGIYKKESLEPIFTVYTPEEHRDKVKKVVNELLN
jgi:uncharacterized protein